MEKEKIGNLISDAELELHSEDSELDIQEVQDEWPWAFWYKYEFLFFNVIRNKWYNWIQKYITYNEW